MRMRLEKPILTKPPIAPEASLDFDRENRFLLNIDDHLELTKFRSRFQDRRDTFIASETVLKSDVF